MKKNILLIEVGDSHADGHCISHSFGVEAISLTGEVTPFNISDAFAIGVKILGMNPLLCIETNGSFLPDTSVRPLITHQLLKDDEMQDRVDPDNSEDLSIDIDDELYANLYLRIAMLGNPSLTLKRIDIPRLDIGGYALYG